VKSLVLFNNKGGVGKTTLVFHIAHMLARLGKRTVVLDYDPQCNITSMCLTEEQLVELWEPGGAENRTVAGCIDLVRRGKGDVREPSLAEIADGFWLLPGHLQLSRFEQALAEEWPKKESSSNERALDVLTALDLLSNMAADKASADIVMLDVGPSLGALNRSALLACDAVVVPLAPDLFSLQGLENVGPTLREWRSDWKVVRDRHMHNRPQANLPPHGFRPIGYIVQQHIARADRPVTAYRRWADKIPGVFRQAVLEQAGEPDVQIEKDPHCIRMIKHFASLVPFAQLARKPVFDLKQADGIGGGQIQAVAKSRAEFEALARDVVKRVESLGPTSS